MILPTRAKARKKPIKRGNLQAQTIFNTSNIKIAFDMAIYDAGATENFVLPGTPVKNINPAENLCTLTYHMKSK